jgi:thioredoxin 1
MSDSENVKPVSDQTFATDVLQAKGTVLVYFWAEWAGLCKLFTPQLEELAAKFPQFTFVKVNVGDNPKTADHYGV